MIVYINIGRYLYQPIILIVYSTGYYVIMFNLYVFVYYNMHSGKLQGLNILNITNYNSKTPFKFWKEAIQLMF